MPKRLVIPFLVGLAGLVGLAAAACGGGDADGAPDQGGAPVSEVTVKLTNWAMEPSSKTLAAGTISFVATHEAEHGETHAAGQEGATHQMLLAPLPKGAKAGRNKFGDPVINLTDIKPGEIKTAKVNLEPGNYELACQVVEEVGGKSVNHYAKGMYTMVTVK